MSAQQQETSQTIRRMLVVIFLLGAMGTAAELILIEHTEDSWQWAPLILLGAGVAGLVCHAAVKAPSTIRIFQITMVLYILSGIIGVGLHFQAKVEFKLEVNPALEGMELVLEAMKRATLPPILAPGVMIHLGLVGLAFTFRHPMLLKK